MNRLLSWLGYALILFIITRFACMYGTEWEFGRYGMPRSIVGPDGRTHPNGQPVDPFLLQAHRADREEETYLVLIAVVGGVMVISVALVSWRHRRYERYLAPQRQFLARAKQYQREERWDEVGKVLREYEEWKARHDFPK